MFKRDRLQNFLGKGVIQIVLITWAILQLFPVLWLCLSSFKRPIEIDRDMLALPKTVYFGNYDFPKVTKGVTVGVYFRNSVIISTSSLAILVVVSVLAGYGIARKRFPGKNALLIVLVGMLGIPIHSLIIPLYYFVSQLGLLSTYPGVIFPYIAFNFPFSVLLLQTYFRRFPAEILEAAKLDGCGDMRMLAHVVLPVSLGAISSVVIINFLNIWNEFLFSLVIMKDNIVKTLPVGLMGFKGQYTVNWGPLFAGLVVAMLPTIAFYFVFHKNIIKGITSGAIKG